MQHGLDPISRTKMRVLDLSSLDMHGNVDIDLHNARLPLIPPRNEGFDPRKLRDPPNPIKPWMAFFNMIRSVFGTGALGLPLAISQVGFVVGPLMMLFTACLLIHTQQCLLWCLNECSRQLRIPYVNYRFGFRLTLLHGPECLAKWGEYGPNIVGVIMVITQISICTVFVLFTADSLRDIADFQSSSTALGWLLIPYLLMAIAMKNLKIISYISMLGNIMNIIAMILTFVQISRDPHGKMVPAVVKPIPLLFAFGTMLFNMSTIAVVIMMDRSLKNPYLLLGKTGMICVGNSTSTIVGTIFGVLGYWSFGTMEENILRSLPFDDPVSLSAISIYMLSIAFTYPLQCYPGLYIISQMIRDRGSGDGPPTDSFMSVVEIVARPIFVLISFFIGYLIPFQGAFVAFVGNLCTTLLAIVFPAVMELCLRYPNNYGRMKFYLIKDIIFILIGFFTWISGIVFSGTLIYIRILAMNSPNRQV